MRRHLHPEAPVTTGGRREAAVSTKGPRTGRPPKGVRSKFDSTGQDLEKSSYAFPSGGNCPYQHVRKCMRRKHQPFNGLMLKGLGFTGELRDSLLCLSIKTRHHVPSMHNNVMSLHTRSRIWDRAAVQWTALTSHYGVKNLLPPSSPLNSHAAIIYNTRVEM